MCSERVGTLRRVGYENFMGTSGPVETWLSGGVNLFAAANGSGKSTLLCALCIGLGYPLSVLRRADSIAGMVKRGCSHCWIEIDLNGPDGARTRVRRDIYISQGEKGSKWGLNTEWSCEECGRGYSKENCVKCEKCVKCRKLCQKCQKKNEKCQKCQKCDTCNTQPTNKHENKNSKTIWQLNKKVVPESEIKTMQKTHHLNVDNLITFLPQERVSELAKLGPKALFQKTISAIDLSLAHTFIELETRALKRVEGLQHLRHLHSALKGVHKEMQIVQTEQNRYQIYLRAKRTHNITSKLLIKFTVERVEKEFGGKEEVFKKSSGLLRKLRKKLDKLGDDKKCKLLERDSLQQEMGALLRGLPSPPGPLDSTKSLVEDFTRQYQFRALRMKRAEDRMDEIGILLENVSKKMKDLEGQKDIELLRRKIALLACKQDECISDNTLMDDEILELKKKYDKMKNIQKEQIKQKGDPKKAEQKPLSSNRPYILPTKEPTLIPEPRDILKKRMNKRFYESTIFPSTQMRDLSSALKSIPNIQFHRKPMGPLLLKLILNFDKYPLRPSEIASFVELACRRHSCAFICLDKRDVEKMSNLNVSILSLPSNLPDCVFGNLRANANPVSNSLKNSNSVTQLTGKTAPYVPPLMCYPSEKGKDLGVICFLHELIDCKEPLLSVLVEHVYIGEIAVVSASLSGAQLDKCVAFIFDHISKAKGKPVMQIRFFQPRMGDPQFTSPGFRPSSAGTLYAVKKSVYDSNSTVEQTWVVPPSKILFIPSEDQYLLSKAGDKKSSNFEEIYSSRRNDLPTGRANGEANNADRNCAIEQENEAKISGYSKRDKFNPWEDDRSNLVSDEEVQKIKDEINEKSKKILLLNNKTNETVTVLQRLKEEESAYTRGMQNLKNQKNRLVAEMEKYKDIDFILADPTTAGSLATPHSTTHASSADAHCSIVDDTEERNFESSKNACKINNSVDPLRARESVLRCIRENLKTIRTQIIPLLDRKGEIVSQLEAVKKRMIMWRNLFEGLKNEYKEVETEYMTKNAEFENFKQAVYSPCKLSSEEQRAAWENAWEKLLEEEGREGVKRFELLSEAELHGEVEKNLHLMESIQADMTVVQRAALLRDKFNTLMREWGERFEEYEKNGERMRLLMPPWQLKVHSIFDVLNNQFSSYMAIVDPCFAGQINLQGSNAFQSADGMATDGDGGAPVERAFVGTRKNLTFGGDNLMPDGPCSGNGDKGKDAKNHCENDGTNSENVEKPNSENVEKHDENVKQIDENAAKTHADLLTHVQRTNGSSSQSASKRLKKNAQTPSKALVAHSSSACTPDNEGDIISVSQEREQSTTSTSQKTQRSSPLDCVDGQRGPSDMGEKKRSRDEAKTSTEEKRIRGESPRGEPQKTNQESSHISEELPEEPKPDKSIHFHVDDYKVNIYVKFKDTDILTLLSDSIQSGGEKGVATMIYILCLQSLSPSSFRVVDEINQGLDAQNERQLFHLVCLLSSDQENPPCQTSDCPPNRAQTSHPIHRTEHLEDSPSNSANRAEPQGRGEIESPANMPMNQQIDKITRIIGLKNRQKNKKNTVNAQNIIPTRKCQYLIFTPQLIPYVTSYQNMTIHFPLSGYMTLPYKKIHKKTSKTTLKNSPETLQTNNQNWQQSANPTSQYPLISFQSQNIPPKHDPIRFY